jgi:hypothetical protein
METKQQKLNLLGGFFVVNDNFPIDFKNPQMLQCIICRWTPQEVGNIFNQNFVLCNLKTHYSV